jgi:hypothetical protein
MHFLPFVHLETTGALGALDALGALEARLAKIPEKNTGKIVQKNTYRN